MPIRSVLLHFVPHLLAALAVLTILDTAPAAAAEGDDQLEPVLLHGQVDAFGVLSEDGESGMEEYGVIRVELRNGREALVDLGKRSDAESLDIQVGDEIHVRGRKEERGGRMVVVADRVQVGRQAHPEVRRVVKGRQRLIEGRVVRIEDLDLPEREGTVRMVTIRLADGTAQALDLGDTQAAAEVSLEAGNRVVASGREVSQGDRSIFTVQHILVLGENPEADDNGTGGS